MSTSISIIVYRGQPIDAIKQRHTALLVSLPDGLESLMHIQGRSTMFTFEARPVRDPEKSPRFLEKIQVAELKGQTYSEIMAVIGKTPIHNIYSAYNCHNWIGYALQRLVDKGWITSDERTNGIEAMVDVVVDAPEDYDVEG
ncbi:hypothetical protein ACLMJK_008493 [Lecanora helva]